MTANNREDLGFENRPTSAWKPSQKLQQQCLQPPSTCPAPPRLENLRQILSAPWMPSCCPAQREYGLGGPNMVEAEGLCRTVLPHNGMHIPVTRDPLRGAGTLNCSASPAFISSSQRVASKHCRRKPEGTRVNPDGEFWSRPGPWALPPGTPGLGPCFRSTQGSKSKFPPTYSPAPNVALTSRL